MSLLIAIVLLLTLFCGEFCATAEVESWQEILTGAFSLTLLPPIFAAVQITIAKHRHAKGESSDWFSRFRFIAIAHSILWAAASVAIIFWLQWPAVVALVPMANKVPLANECMLVAPALLSLILSWAVFIFGAPRNSLAKSKTRASIFILWLRMQIAMVTAPMLFAFLVTDCLGLAASIELTPVMKVIAGCLCGAFVFASVLFYPQLMLFVWSTKRIANKQLEDRCDQLFEIAKIRRRKVRLWKTGKSIVNAAAVGIVPGTEVIIISDMLLDKFSQEEVDAIVMHEIGHLRHCHCIKRIAMVLVPLLLLGIDQATGVGLHQIIADSELLNRLLGSLAQFLPAIAFVLYLLVISKTVFRNMEFEADHFAIETLSGVNECCPMESALEKMAAIYPRHVDRRSGLHPSIRQRLSFAMHLNAELAGEKRPFGQPVPAPKNISLDPVAAK